MPNSISSKADNPVYTVDDKTSDSNGNNGPSGTYASPQGSITVETRDKTKNDTPAATAGSSIDVAALRARETEGKADTAQVDRKRKIGRKNIRPVKNNRNFAIDTASPRATEDLMREVEKLAEAREAAKTTRRASALPKELFKSEEIIRKPRSLGARLAAGWAALQGWFASLGQR